MYAAAERQAGKENIAQGIGNKSVLNGVPLLFAAVFFLLFFCLKGPWHFPFCCLVQQQHLAFSSRPLSSCEHLLKFLVCLRRQHTGKVEGIVQDYFKAVEKFLALLLLHAKKVSMMLL